MHSLSDSLRFMKTRGFNVARFYECKTKGEISSAFDKLTKPVVLKVDSKKHTHKTEVKGVVMDVVDKKTALIQFDRLMLLGESVVIQEQRRGTELIIGIEYDDSFGRIIMFGLGGLFVELLEDVSFRACPITQSDAAEMITEIKYKKILEGFRGGPKISTNLLKRLLVKVCNFAEKDNVKSLDLNPIIFEKGSYYVVDARMETLPK